MSRAISVALPIPVDKLYSYELPGELDGSVGVGSLVLVPVRKRTYTGIVTELDVKVREGVQLRTVRAAVSGEPLINSEILRLTRWISQYYVCSWGEALNAALPAGIQTKERIVYYLASESAADWRGISPELQVHLIKHRKTTPARLKRIGLRIPEQEITKAESQGALRRIIELQDPTVGTMTGKFLSFKPAFKTSASLRDLIPQFRGVKQKELIKELINSLDSGESEPSLKEIRKACDANLQTFKSLEKRGIFSIVQKNVYRIPEWMKSKDLPTSTAPEFHPYQAEAVKAIRDAVNTETFQTFALHGVTGSGKTEVYLSSLETVFSLNKTAIVLVPEISLTPQTVHRFRSRFGNTVAVLHSRMAKGERHDVWQLIRAGRYRVVIGPRSAVLAPVKNLGLIIVDEEHDSSYKQGEMAPRYHARDVAVMRAMKAECVCVLGSATLSLETLVNANQGKYTLLSMPDRAPAKGRSAVTLPSIQIIDLCHEREENGLDGPLSEPLIQAIKKRLNRNEQVILLQNRRGYAPILECQNCGFVPQCVACSVSMTYHQGDQRLRCHYCGYSSPVLVSCPKCGASAFAPIGAGTQRVAEELGELFRTAKILRMDRDSTRTKDAHHEILSAFADGKADILIGTQMVAKGLDFGRVTLVGVINCDLGLRLPDFRSEERTFQLLMQVAGRAGRADLPGEVLLQTKRPFHPIFSFLQAHDFNGYAQRMMQDRQNLLYPPFGRIAGIQIRGAPKPAVQKLAYDWRSLLLDQLPSTVTVLGPEQTYIERVEHQYRYFLIIKAPKTYFDLQQHLRTILKISPSTGRDIHVSVNIDGLEQI
ncbi:MAG: primosomal protein N' [Bacteroidetes bacterium]|nr:primosomal protein N' [Bacteroidota bacterium]